MDEWVGGESDGSSLSPSSFVCEKDEGTLSLKQDED